MNIDKNEIIKKIKISYESFYDILYFDECILDDTISAQGKFMDAEFHMHTEKYILAKAARMYQMDTNEFVYFYYYDRLTKALFDEAIDTSYNTGFPKIQPKPDHRSSYISVVFICNTCDEDAFKALKKYRRRQSFHFSLWGWMEVHTAMVDLRSGSVFSNSDGLQTRKFLKNILQPKRRKKLF